MSAVGLSPELVYGMIRSSLYEILRIRMLNVDRGRETHEALGEHVSNMIYAVLKLKTIKFDIQKEVVNLMENEKLEESAMSYWKIMQLI